MKSTKVCFYFLTLLFLNTMLIGDWYKIMAVSEPLQEHSFFVKKASRNIMAVLLHNLIENEDSNQDNEDSEDDSETDESPQEFYLHTFISTSFLQASSLIWQGLHFLSQISPYLETVSPPPKN